MKLTTHLHLVLRLGISVCMELYLYSSCAFMMYTVTVSLYLRLIRGTKILQKLRSHLRILGTRRVKEASSTLRTHKYWAVWYGGWDLTLRLYIN